LNFEIFQPFHPRTPFPGPPPGMTSLYPLNPRRRNIGARKLEYTPLL
jgi:hypothetical protein